MLENFKNPKKLGGKGKKKKKKKGRKKSKLLLCMGFLRKKGSLEFQTLCGKISNLGIKFYFKKILLVILMLLIYL